uniref:Uncharacterized protein n=4 Tax=Rhizophagus irregularis TaxID=588596 RepID=U9UPI9_RHIID
MSFNVYTDEIKRLSWENSKLREELRRKDHMMDKKGKLEKTQERIISQKNEQIRKISQEVEKTRSELKKVKTDINKEINRPKKSNKGRSTSNRRKREEILEIPVLPENTSNDQQAKEARDIFSTIYQNTGARMTKNFIRWYDAKLGLKGRQERDQWQTVRDLTNEEMESIKKGNTYDFTKKLQQTSKTAFIKIIKITKNWKVIGYFKNLKEMEEAVEDSCTEGDINRVWLVRNKKTIYKDGDDKTRMKKPQEKIDQDKVIATDNKIRLPLRLASEPKTPITPPERIYRELGNFASRKESLLHPSKADKPLRISKTPDENEVVEMIKNWRVGEENTPDHNDTSEKKDYRTLNKIKYVQYQESTHDGSLVDKLKEVKDIFNQTSNEMEWEKINVEAVDELRKEHEIKNWDEAKNWALEKNNFFRLEQKIISLVEKSKIFQEYTTLNDNFKQRLENENRYQDEKKIGEKRPILESPSKWSYIEDEEERNKAFKAFYLEKRQQELIPSTSTIQYKEEDEENEEEAAEEEKLELKTSPSKKTSGRKKTKKKNNKK